MHRSELTVDLGAIRRNARTLLRVLEGAQLWAVVKANAYGHGAIDVAGALMDEGAGGLRRGAGAGRRAGDDPRPGRARRGSCARGGNDQLRARLPDRGGPAADPQDGRRCLSWPGKYSGARTPGSWAVPSATSCSDASSSTSTSPSASRSRLRGPTRAGRVARRFRSRSATAPG